MGIKYSKSNPASAEATALLLSKLVGIDGVTSKKMFGGHGIFHDSKMFALIDSKGNCFIKADDSTRPDYLAKGSEQHSRMPYYSLPQEVEDDAEMLISWIEKAIEISK